MIQEMPQQHEMNLAERLALFQNLPIVHEDDPEWEMGESDLHALAEHIIRYGIEAHLERRPQYRVFSNLNLHFQPKFPSVYISPDVMVVTPLDPKQKGVRSYRVGRDGPPPILVAEVLSEETAKERDLDEKLEMYALMGAEEYILVDELAKYLPERLLLKRLQSDRTCEDLQDKDGGITSRLGFRLIWDVDERLRVLDTRSGRRYVRPDEAERRIRALEAELALLQKQSKKGPPKRRKKP